jgi:LysR family transcriptional activator of nhaA
MREGFRNFSIYTIAPSVASHFTVTDNFQSFFSNRRVEGRMNSLRVPEIRNLILIQNFYREITHCLTLSALVLRFKEGSVLTGADHFECYKHGLDIPIVIYIIKSWSYTFLMVPLNYNQLYYFYQIAESGSIVLASKKVLISSPALSMQLKELEENLGTPLFSRVGKKLVLTEAGMIVHEYARDIFKLGFELKDTLGDRNTGKERAKIEIGCQDSIPKRVAEDLLTFLIDEKGCKVTLREGNREQLIRMQNEFKLDLILTNSVPGSDHNSIFETKLLRREELIFVGHPKHKNVKLKDAPYILPTYDASVRPKLDFYFKEKVIVPDVIAEVEDNATEVDLALKGYGLIAVMRTSVAPFLKDKSLIEISSLKNIEEEIWMLFGKRKILNPIAIFAMKNFTLPLK